MVGHSVGADVGEHCGVDVVGACLAGWVGEVERVEAWVYGEVEHLGWAVGTSEGGVIGDPELYFTLSRASHCTVDSDRDHNLPIASRDL